MNKRYRIPACNMHHLTIRINRLIKLAAKLGTAPITYKVGPEFEVPLIWSEQDKMEFPWFVDVRGECPMDQIKGFIPYHWIEVSGEPPVLEGWIFAAVLQQVEIEKGGHVGILRTIATDLEIPASLRDRIGQCDHCGTDRYRNDVFVVYHRERNEFKVVGRTCLKDFLHHEDPETCAKMATYLSRITETFERSEDPGFYGMGNRLASSFPVPMVLRIAAMIIRKDGYMSKMKARETNQEFRATAEIVKDYILAKKGSLEYEEMMKRYQMSDADQVLAEQAQDWAQGLADVVNDYSTGYHYTIAVLANATGIELRDFGYVVSIISSYGREMDRQQETRITFANSEHIGKVGEKSRLTVTLLSANRQQGDSYGYNNQTLKTVMTYAQMREDGRGANRITWFASGDPGEEMTEIGKEYKIIGTVSKHGEYRGSKQTTINRVVVDKGQKIAPKKLKSLGKDANGEKLFKGDQVEFEVPYMQMAQGCFRLLRWERELQEFAGKYEMRKLIGTITRQSPSSKTHLYLDFITPDGSKSWISWAAKDTAKVKAAAEASAIDSRSEAA